MFCCRLIKSSTESNNDDDGDGVDGVDDVDDVDFGEGRKKVGHCFDGKKFEKKKAGEIRNKKSPWALH